MILNAVNITVGYGDTCLIEDLSFSLGVGQLLILSGENGSGKTSLMRCLIGAEPLLRGVIELASDYQCVYLSPQYTGLFLSLTARQNLALYTKNPDQQIEKFRILKADVPCKHLSLGQKTMVSLAISLTNSHNILLIDEAMNSLDSENRERILEIIQQNTAPCILVSHSSINGLRKDVVEIKLNKGAG